MNLIHVNQYCTYPRERKEPLYLKLREAKNDENVHWQEDFCDIYAIA